MYFATKEVTLLVLTKNVPRNIELPSTPNRLHCKDLPDFCHSALRFSANAPVRSARERLIALERKVQWPLPMDTTYLVFTSIHTVNPIGSIWYRQQADLPAITKLAR